MPDFFIAWIAVASLGWFVAGVCVSRLWAER